MKFNDIYKRAFNQCLGMLASIEPGSDLGAESGWARSLGVSRTTVHALFKSLLAQGIISADGRRRIAVRRPEPSEFFPEDETRSVRNTIERRFMDMVLRREIRPGQQINNLELARQFSVSPSALREYLSEFNQCGLLKRCRNSSWVFLGFDLDFARELSDVREMFELRSALAFAELPPHDPAWQALSKLEQRHIELLADIDGSRAAFSEVDNDLHMLVNSASRNRFVERFHALSSLIFHYHYQWIKDDEKQHRVVAIQEHLAYIAALRSRDRDAIRTVVLAHLQTARLSLFASIERGELRLARVSPRR